MTRPDIEAIRKRVDAATPGPWEAHAGTITTANGDDDVADWISHKDEDVAFIASAREDVPALLAYVAELEKRDAGWQEVLMGLAAAFPEVAEVLNQLADKLGTLAETPNQPSQQDA